MNRSKRSDALFFKMGCLPRNIENFVVFKGVTKKLTLFSQRVLIIAQIAQN